MNTTEDKDDVKLSGAALDTLHSLFWFGPREAGEIPSKSGEAELSSYGYCIRHEFEQPPKGKDSYLCVLTQAGYAYAYSLFVEPGNAHMPVVHMTSEKGPLPLYSIKNWTKSKKGDLNDL